MAGDGQPDEGPADAFADGAVDPPAQLLDAASAAVPDWLGRAVDAACRNGGVDPSAVRHDLDRIVAAGSQGLLSELGVLLATDVDDQRSTPLTVCRDVGAAVAAELARLGVEPPGATPAGVPLAEALGLAPASWADIDPSLHDPGITWGAWKAMTVLRRRRDEGLR